MNIKQFVDFSSRRPWALAGLGAANALFAAVSLAETQSEHTRAGSWWNQSQLMLAEAEQEQEVTPEQVYYFACAQCHQTGLNAAPKYRSRRAWAPIIEKGRELVYRNTLEGMGAMPPRGGKPNLTEEQVKMAVDYLIEGAGGWPEEG